MFLLFLRMCKFWDVCYLISRERHPRFIHLPVKGSENNSCYDTLEKNNSAQLHSNPWSLPAPTSSYLGCTWQRKLASETINSVYIKEKIQSETQCSTVTNFKLAHLHLLVDFLQEKHAFLNHKEFNIFILQARNWKYWKGTNTKISTFYSSFSKQLSSWRNWFKG